jgi:hypothetical protein
VAAFPEYRGPLLNHLLSAKLRHWEKPTRALAARALAALAPAAGAGWVAGRALPALLGRVADDALEARTGAVLGVAELLPALAAAGVTDVDTAAAAAQAAGGGGGSERAAGLGLESAAEPGAELAPAVAGVLCVLSGAGLYRGKGGELMREAAARLVECTAQAVSGLRFGGGGGGGGGGSGKPSAAAGAAADPAAAPAAALRPQSAGSESQRPATAGAGQLQPSGLPRLSLPLGPEYHAAALALAEDCLCHTLGSIRAAGAAALASYARAHCAEAPVAAALRELVVRCLGRLRDPNVAHRWVQRGLRAAPRALGRGADRPKAQPCLRSRCGAQKPTGAFHQPPIAGRGPPIACLLTAPAPLPRPPHRRGAAEALGALPAALLLAAPGASGGAPVPGGDAIAALCAAAAAESLPLEERDVEARVAAVDALGRLSVELHTWGDGPPAGAGGGGAPPVARLRAAVVPCLLAALRDHTIDNRGDVGSWVRAAAAEALVSVVPLALAERAAGYGERAGGADGAEAGGRGLGRPAGADQAKAPHQQQRQQQGQQQQQERGDGGSGSGGAPPGGASMAMEGGDATLAAAAVGGLLRIGVERIARLREAAAAAVAALLAQPTVWAGGGGQGAMLGRGRGLLGSYQLASSRRHT